MGVRIAHDVGRTGRGRIEDGDAVEMGELRADAPEIVPHAAEDLFPRR
jgi:hypothetical protein